MSWGSRLYERRSPTLVADDGQRVPLHLVGSPTMGEQGHAIAKVRVNVPLTAGRSYLLALGLRRALRYPDDLVTDPLSTQIVVTAHRSDEPARTPSRRELKVA